MKALRVLTRMLPLLVVVPLLALVAWSGARADDAHKLLFTSKRTGNQEIFLANADGTEANPLSTPSFCAASIGQFGL